MTYTEAFSNTVLVDLLEALHLVKVPSNFRPRSNSTVADKGEETTVPLEDQEDAQSDTGSRIDAVSRAENQSDDPFLVDWNGPDDPEFPQNWSTWKKALMFVQVFILTSVTYMGSSIYTPGQDEIQEKFHVGHVAATLNLSLYVMGYGVGPLIFSPLSEVPSIGRNYLYVVTLSVFVLLQIPSALSNNFAGLVVTRFIAGLFSSPSLSTGGATLGDFSNPKYLVVLVAGWSVGAVSGPALGPLLGAAMTQAQDYRLTFWFLMASCGSVLVTMVVFFPETSHQNLLIRRARRIRKETGDSRYYTQAELDQKPITMVWFAQNVLYRPLAIFLLEPGVMALDLFIGMSYACFYLFFEAYPIVFVDYYHFTLVEFGLSFLGFAIGATLAFFVLVYFYFHHIWPKIVAGTMVPEEFLKLTMATAWLFPVSLFLFGWTAQVHWILPIIWQVMFVLGVFNIFQTGFSFLSVSYPRFLASVFAGNTFVRAALACAFPLFGRAMYENLGSERFPVGWGATLLGFIGLGMTAIPFVLYKFGPALRGRSKFAN